VSTWNKKQISKSEIEELVKKYGVDSLTASIMSRRNIVDGKSILYLMEDDLRFQHSPFSFNTMEDAVDRILDAKDDKAKVLIYGDRDVDGVSATTVLYDCLTSMGIDTQYRLPSGDDAYGLSIQAVDEFAKDYGSLIITVDCGISNNVEIAHAAELGLDVIVVDHHNPPEDLPSPAIIVDAKCEDSGYPFKDISGCAVVYKLVQALRFSQSDFYKQEICLLNVTPINEAYTIDCVKLKNLVPTSKMSETIVSGTIGIMQTRLPEYLSGQQIFVWDKEVTTKLLKDAFGSGVEFNLMDIRPEVAKVIPQVSGLSLLRIKDMSKIAKYGDHPATEIGGFYNIFVTYAQQKLKSTFPEIAAAEEKDLQLVALAALADIMPLKDENRIFVRKGIASMNAGRIRPGLLELMSSLNLLGKRINSTTLSWDVVSNLNAAGRLGHAEYAADLFISKDPAFRETMAQKIIALNVERKKLSVDAWNYAAVQAETSIPLHNNKLCVVIDERINRGVSGILAGRLVSAYKVPAIAVTFVDNNIAVGSMRSCRGYDITVFLDQLADLFINHGGHNFAAGFSFTRDKLSEFERRVKELSSIINLSETNDDVIDLDAEIPESYLTPKLLDVSDRFEPFGEENPELIFMSERLPIVDAIVMGKGEKQHLKLTLGCGKYKWPALFWNEGERLHRDFEKGDKVDILYHIERNTFNGMETPQLILTDIRKSENQGDNK